MNKTAELVKEFCEKNNLHYYGEYMTGSRWYKKPCVAVQASEPLTTLTMLCDYIRDDDPSSSATEILGEPYMDNAIAPSPSGLVEVNIIYFPAVTED